MVTHEAHNLGYVGSTPAPATSIDFSNKSCNCIARKSLTIYMDKNMNTTRQFQRTIEDFVCENCDLQVKGNGYTNHCPRCLWSKHVDINPGDRMAKCGGMMEPIAIESKDGGYIIVHRCVKCGYEKRNKKSEEDNFEAILKLSSRPLQSTINKKGK